MRGNLGAVVKQTTGFRSAAEPISTIAAADREVNVPPTKGDPFVGDGQDGGEGGLFAKSSPSPPHPLSPSKTLIRENHKELPPRQGFP